MKQFIDKANTSGLHVITETVGRRSKKGELLRGPQAVGLDIILRGTAQLDGNPAAKQAFINSAATWEAKLKNPVTLSTIKSDKRLVNMYLVRAARLSVQSVKKEEYDCVLQLSEA